MGKVKSFFKTLFNKVLAAAKQFISSIFDDAVAIVIGELKDFALSTIQELASTDLTNEEKRTEAFSKIKDYAVSNGIDAKDSIINLVIEMAVSYLKK